MSGIALGVDVGGSSIKYAKIAAQSGTLVNELLSSTIPQPATRAALLQAIAALIEQNPEAATIGVALPSVIRNGIICTAANLDRSLIGFAIEEQLQNETGRRVRCLNDADAAGLAELRWGAAKGVHGVVMVLTFGTGIGSALFMDGRLIPNTELGHLELGGVEAELRASARARIAEALSWSQWADRVNAYLQLINDLFWPELIVLGGAISADYPHYAHHLRSRAAIRSAAFAAAAGVVGAAMAAAGELA
jgi:polyphosphate glucokinase